MRHNLDLTTEQLKILFIAIPDHTKEWEHMKPVIEKINRHLEVANMPGVNTASQVIFTK